MLELAPPYILYSVTVLVSAIISIYAVKKIIFITSNRKLFDIPDNVRKIHGAYIPSLGGIGIFVSYMIVASFFMMPDWYYVVAASVVLFFTGIYDDIMNMRPSKKLVAQFLASAIAVVLADVRITSLYGILGIETLPYLVSVGTTVFLCTFFINVFNFMDGIDGLACTLAILYTGTCGLLFATMGNYGMAGIAFSIAGATIGLLYFNRPPARIYMGDTGSMLLGFSIFVLCVRCIGSLEDTLPAFIGGSSNLVMLLLAMLFLPIFDAMRVFILRASRGISPLHADRMHLHYYLLDAGLSHGGAVAVIGGTTIMVVVSTWLLRDTAPLLQVAMMTAVTSAVVYAVKLMRQRAKKGKNQL